MTSRVYKTAQGKTLDLGQLVLQNEHIRAVGNMNVNARGDRLNSDNRVIETKNQRVQKQNQKQIASNVTSGAVHTSNLQARQPITDAPPVDNINSDSAIVNSVTESAPAPLVDDTPSKGGLAAAIARSKTVVQEKDKTPQQLRQQTGINRI